MKTTNRDIEFAIEGADAVGPTWCADMYVSPSHRRRGIGQSLLSRMLREDRARLEVLGADGKSHRGARVSARWV